MKRMFCVLTFRGGAQVRFETKRIKTSKSQVTGALTKIEWETPDDAQAELHSLIDLSEVVCVHIENEEPE